VEVSATSAISGASHIWSALLNRECTGCAASRSNLGAQGFRAAKKIYADVAAIFYSYGAKASTAVCHGGWTNSMRELFCGTGAGDLSGTSFTQALASQEMVGILLLHRFRCAREFAAMLMGKVPVNLNYTASNETLPPAHSSAI